MHIEPGVDEVERQWQADITEADDRDAPVRRMGHELPARWRPSTPR